MGFAPIEAGAAQFRDCPPPDLDEFAPIRMQRLPDASGEGEPEADVGMPHRGRTRGLGHREKERPVPERRVEMRRNAEFFDGLTPNSIERMLAGLDMASGRQPQARQPVVAEQHAPGRPVDQQEIRDQMR